jgi:hypothetical protein
LFCIDKIDRRRLPSRETLAARVLGGIGSSRWYDVSVVYYKRKWNILWNVRVFRGINKAMKQQPRPI